MMDEQKSKQAVTPISDETVAAMRRASAMSLPDDPSAARMKASVIRRYFWEAVFGDKSLLAEVQRVIREVNLYLAELPSGDRDGGGSIADIEQVVSEHNTGTDAHADLRLELKAMADRINDILDSDDETLNEMHEVVAIIKSNKSLIEAITTSKVSVTDIVDNLATNVANKPLSAAQGVALKALIDAITVTDAEKTAWNAKLGQSDLQTAIDAALAQAKESGEFDGAEGKTPVKGTDYFTDVDKSEIVAAAKASLPTITMVGTDADGVEHTWTIYGT